MTRFFIHKIVSGGQTGADRAALDACRAAGCPHGGWLPKGRKTEDGPLPSCYGLSEMVSASYRKRTEQNVIDSDGTLILSHGPLTGGSLLTRKLAAKYGRPCLHIDLTATAGITPLQATATWIKHHEIQILNVAGPRASGDPGIYAAVYALISELLQLPA